MVSCPNICGDFPTRITNDVSFCRYLVRLYVHLLPGNKVPLEGKQLMCP